MKSYRVILRSNEVQYYTLVQASNEGAAEKLARRKFPPYFRVTRVQAI